MVAAIDELELEEKESKECLVKYFTYTAHYIVAAMAYMRPDQVSDVVIFSTVVDF